MALYTIKDLTFSYPEEERKVLNHISLTINEGEFVLLCGKSGSGKSTLLKQLKPLLTPNGTSQGEVIYEGMSISQLSELRQAKEIGFVMQDPENQIVTDKVWHELSFGLEGLGYSREEIELRIGEMSSYFGIQGWYEKNTMQLSGGQKQLLNLAAIMSMEPNVLILDEPTAMLDPLAASDFIQTLKRINEDMGITIIMTEQRLEKVMSLADRMVIMEEGEIIADSTPRKVPTILREKNHYMFEAMPGMYRVFEEIEEMSTYPLTINEGRKWFLNHLSQENIEFHHEEDLTISTRKEDYALICKDLWFRYEKNGLDILKGLSLGVETGKITCILGGNGTGKSTFLSLLAGVKKPFYGKVIKREERICLLPQFVQGVFAFDRVEDELLEMSSNKDEIQKIIKLCEIHELLNKHPFDLSGGEKQRVAVAKTLLAKPQVYLFDEPTKGMDGEFKHKFGMILRELKKENKTVVLVSHDVDFCGEYGDVAGLFFDGKIVSLQPKRRFFSGNIFYTTAVNKMLRGICNDVITSEDVIGLWEQNKKKTELRG